jgi:hypothetical protein
MAVSAHLSIFQHELHAASISKRRDVTDRKQVIITNSTIYEQEIPNNEQRNILDAMRIQSHV